MKHIGFFDQKDILCSRRTVFGCTILTPVITGDGRVKDSESRLKTRDLGSLTFWGQWDSPQQACTSFRTALFEECHIFKSRSLGVSCIQVYQSVQ